MGHHGRGYDFRRGGHGDGFNLHVLARMPRGLKIGLVVAAVLVLLVGLALAGLVALVLVKLVGGGTPPAYMQDMLELERNNLQPLLGFWKNLQGVAGK